MQIMKIQLKWTEEEILRYSTAISSAAILGMGLGGMMAGRFIRNGRRRGALIMCVIAFFGGLF